MQTGKIGVAAESCNNNNSNENGRQTCKDGPLAPSTPLIVKLPAVKKKYTRGNYRKVVKDMQP